MRFSVLSACVGSLLLTIPAFSQSDCPGCTTSLPLLPQDTLYLDSAAAGVVGTLYENSISFRLPKSTTPVAAVDSTVLPGLPINGIRILSFTGLPPGLEVFPSQRDFNPQDQTDGCLQLCGTPVLPGTYIVQALISAQVFIFNQTTSIRFPLTIRPASVATEGFTVVNDAGCGSLVSTFINNIPANNRAGFSYLWDFGNGNSSQEEQPEAQTYDSPGVYPIQYQAVIDTTGYFLTQVLITELACNDLFNGAPDVKLDIFSPEGQRIFQSPIASNATLPLAFDMNIPLEEGTYRIEVIDDDSFIELGDDPCGTLLISRTQSGLLENGPLRAQINIIHPVDTVRSGSWVTVHPIPDNPVLSALPPFCTNEPVLLTASPFTQGLQWYKDSLPMTVGDIDSVYINVQGSYTVSYTSEYGCTSFSSPTQVTLNAPPPATTLSQQGNLLRLSAAYLLQPGYQLQWWLDGVLLEGATEALLCTETDGWYELQIMDAATGCSQWAGIEASYDEEVSCTTATEERPTNLSDLLLWPNPGNGLLRLEGYRPIAGLLNCRVMDLQGRELWSATWQQASGTFSIPLDWTALPQGLLLVRLDDGISYQLSKYLRL
jgi:hypothetical protein